MFLWDAYYSSPYFQFELIFKSEELLIQGGV
jgi:hypothetical protein